MIQNLSYIATIVVSGVAFLTFATGWFIFYRKTAWECEARAVGLLKDYMEFTMNMPYPDSKDKTEDIDDYGFFIAEAIFNLTGGHPAWKTTIGKLIRYHEARVNHKEFDPQSYNRKFISLVAGVLNRPELAGLASRSSGRCKPRR